MVADPKLKPSVGRSWGWVMAPVLASIFPVLVLYFQSIEETNLSDALIACIILMAVVIAVAHLFRLIFSGAPRGSLAAVVFVVWAFSYSGYMRAGRLILEAMTVSPLKDYFLMGLWIVLLIVSLLVVFRLRLSDSRMAKVNQFVLLACLFAIGLALVEAARAHFQIQHPTSIPASIWENESEVMPATWKPVPIANPRDVYYLLFDRYANDVSLNRFFNFDNSEFYRELEKRGFIVDREATTSYPMTAPSMSSTLNMRYLSSEFGNISDYFSTVQANDVGKFFIQAGYTYHYFGNQYAPLRKSSIAQWNMKVSMLPNEFDDSLVNMTPFRPLIGQEYKYRFVIDKFTKVAELAKDSAPTFAYAHFLVPHPPYAFARDGSALTELGRATRPEQELYIDQLVATNRLILKMLDDLLSASSTKPIIVLQADEGPYLMEGDESLSLDEQIIKRTGILNAILIPDDAIRQGLPKPLMPVNTFRFLFKEYFNAPIDLLPDRIFYWESPQPTGAAKPGSRIIEVTQKLRSSKQRD